jgi:MacB-like periplasmic core domain
MFQDLRVAMRMLLQTKGWTAVVLLSLALGIGANAALFTGVNGLLIRTLAVPHPETLVRLRYAGNNDMRRSSNSYGYNDKNDAGEDIRETASFAVYQALRSANQTLTDIAASAPIGAVNLTVDGKADLASGLLVSGNYFDVLHIIPQMGRTITPEDDTGTGTPVAVISYGFWQKRFGGLPNVLGKSVVLNSVPVTIVGVTTREFTGIQSLNDSAPDITLPVTFDNQLTPNRVGYPRLADPTYWWLQMMGRLKPGVTLQQVKGNLDGTFQAAARAGWNSYFNSITPEERALSRNQNRTAVRTFRSTPAAGAFTTSMAIR